MGGRGRIGDVGGLLVIVALLAMWIGVLRYTGQLDTEAQHERRAAVLLAGGIALAVWGMATACGTRFLPAQAWNNWRIIGGWVWRGAGTELSALRKAFVNTGKQNTATTGQVDVHATGSALQWF